MRYIQLRQGTVPGTHRGALASRYHSTELGGYTEHGPGPGPVRPASDLLVQVKTTCILHVLHDLAVPNLSWAAGVDLDIKLPAVPE
jgi:hypothetical protein